MKKLLTLAMALCICGAASAITLDWETATPIGTEFTGASTTATKTDLPSYTAVAIGDSADYGAIVTGGIPGGSRVIFGIGNGTKTDTAGNISVAVNGNGALELWFRAPTGTYTGTKITATADGKFVANTEYEMVLRINRETETAGGTNDTVISLFVNNEEVLKTNVTLADSAVTNIYVGDYYGTLGGSLYGAGKSVQAYVAAPVPEPTTLALLALGVAGLALKRKNA